MNQVSDIFDQWVTFYMSLSAFLKIVIWILLFNCFLMLLFLVLTSLRQFQQSKMNLKRIEGKQRLFDFYREVLATHLELSTVKINHLWKSSNQVLSAQSFLDLAEFYQENKTEIHPVNLANLQSIFKVDFLLNKREKRKHSIDKIKWVEALFVLNYHRRYEGDERFSILHQPDLWTSLSYLGFRTDSGLNEWEQLLLVKLFSVYPEENLPDFREWLKQEANESQLTAVLKLMTHFEQKPSIHTLVPLLKYENDKVKQASIALLGKLKMTEAEESLWYEYDFNDFGIKKEIIHAIVFIRSGKAIDFLKYTYRRAMEVEEVRLLLSALYVYNSESLSYFQGEMANASRYEKELFNSVIHSSFNKLKEV